MVQKHMVMVSWGKKDVEQDNTISD